MNLQMLEMWDDQISVKMRVLKKMSFRLFECFGGDNRFNIIIHQEWHNRIYSKSSMILAGKLALEINSWQDYKRNFLASLPPPEESRSWGDILPCDEQEFNLDIQTDLKNTEINDWNSRNGLYLREGIRETLHDLIKYLSWCEIKANIYEKHDFTYICALKDSINYYKIDHCFRNLEELLKEVYPSLELVFLLRR